MATMDPTSMSSLTSDNHALACGVVLGALMKSQGQDAIIDDVRPFMDRYSNYTNQILVRIGSQHFTVTVDEATAEAMRNSATDQG